MARRFGFAVLLAIGVASPALADTVWLNQKGEDNLAQIEAWIAPARAYEYVDPSGKKVHYLRGRIVPDPSTKEDVKSDSQGVAVTFQAWSRPAGAKPSDPITTFSAPFVLSLSMVQRVDHEVDGLVDFRLMFSDRDKLDTSAAPLPVKFFGAALNRVLENPPEGTIDLNLDGAPAPAEPSSVQSQLKLPGWIVRALVDPVPGMSAAIPAGSTKPVSLPDGRTVLGVQQSAQFDPLDPRLLNVGIERAVQELLLGLARESYYRGHRNEVSDQELVDLSRQAIRFLSRLAMLRAPDKFQSDGSSASLSGVAFRRRLYRDVGLAARDSVIRALEAAAPGSIHPGDFTEATRRRIRAEIAVHPDPIERAQFEQQFAPLFQASACPQCEVVCDPSQPHTCPRALAPEARLEVSPSRLAHEALAILIESPEWWAVHGNGPGSQELPDTDRLTRAVLDLSALPASAGGVLYPDTRRGDAPHYMEVRANEAPLLLVRFLRPLVPIPTSAGGDQDPSTWFPSDPGRRQALENRLKISSRTFADELGRSLTELDPARRDAARRALQEAAQVKGDPLVSNQIVENLLAVASAQTGIEGPSDDSEAGTELTTPPAPGTSPGGSWSGFNGGETDRVDGLALERGEVQQYVRARRKHAVRVLMILSRLAARSDSEEERRLGRYVLQRLTDLRESIAQGRASTGEKSLIGVLNRLRKNPEVTLQREADFLNHQLRGELEDRTREVEQELESFRADLERAVREHRDRDARRLQEECDQRRRRLDHLTRLAKK